jgi:hypothetical protein
VQDGTPADPDAYDYVRAARDALHFAALFDRLVQNLRRYLGYDVQYFAAIEPQRRLAPHIHIAMRGTMSRAELRRGPRRDLPPGVVAGHLDGPVRRRRAAGLGRADGQLPRPGHRGVLPTWDQALDAIGPEDEPLHVARFGDRFDAQGVLPGSKDAAGASAT